MKRISVLAMLLLFSIIMSCKKENNSSTSVSTSQVTTTATSGTWKIISFTEDGTNNTGSYNGYNFVFSGSGAVAASNGGNTATGTWQTLTDSGKTKFILDFNEPAFESISEDWEVLELSSTRMKLQHVSGGNGGTDILILEKN